MAEISVWRGGGGGPMKRWARRHATWPPTTRAMTRATATTATSRRRRVNRRCQACVLSPSMVSNTKLDIRLCFLTGTSAPLQRCLLSCDDHGMDAGFGLGEGDDVLAAAADEQ